MDALAHPPMPPEVRHRLRAWAVLGEVAQNRGDIATAQRLFSECSMSAQQTLDRHTIWRTHAVLYDLLRETLPQLASVHRRIAAEMMTHILAGIDDEELKQIFLDAEPVRSVMGPEPSP